MKKLSFLIINFISFSVLFSQPLMDGMGIITHSTEFGNGPSFQIFQAGDNENALLGSNWSTTFYTPDAAIYSQWSDIGAVFGIAIDNEKNIYLSASPIMYYTANSGAAGFGGVYKVNNDDWSISSFITTGNGINDIPNIGSGIGNVCYDKFNNQLLITNLEDGKIYRYDMNGVLLSTFDPFTLDDNSGGFAGYNEGIWGINVFEDQSSVKVYFSRIVDNNTPSIWYVELDENGEFYGTEVFCFDVTGGSVNVVSDLTFDSQMNMYIAERGQNGFSLGSGYNAHNSRGIKYKFENNNWILDEILYVGAYGYGANTSGGVAISDNNNVNAEENCEGYVWYSGDALTGCCDIYGATGIPPNAGNTINNSVFVDVQDIGSAVGLNKGAFGDIEIYTEPKEGAIFIDSILYKCENSSIQLNAVGGTNYEWSPSTGLNNPFISDPISTIDTNINYTVTGKVCAGEIDTAEVIIEIINGINTDTINFDISDYNGFNTSCINSNDGWISLNISLDDFSLSWVNGSNSNYISGLSSGVYGVEIEDTFGCSYNLSTEIISPTEIITNLTSSDYNSYGVSCYESSDGYIISNISGGVPPYSYLWSENNITSPNIYNLSSDMYFLEITDLNECQEIENITLSEPIPLINAFTVSDYKGFNTSCFNSNDGFVNINMNGGVAPYDYIWSNGYNDSFNENLSSGVYFLQVTDENNCSYFESFDLISPTEIITSIESINNYNGFDISCYGSSDGEILLSVQGGNPLYTINWSSGQSSHNIDGLQSGQYVAQVSDLNGCVVFDSITLIEPTALTQNIQSANNYNGFDISCDNYLDGGIDLSVNGGVTPYNFNWNNSATSEDLVNVAAGNYNVSITDANNCQISSTINLNEPTPFSFSSIISDYNGYNVSCFNGSNGFIDYTIGGSVSPYNFNWNGPNGFTSSNEDINNLSSGDYSLQVIDDNGCLHSASFNFIEPSNLISEINSLTDYNGFDISCNGYNDGSVATVYSGGVPPYDVFWENGLNSDTLTNLFATDYLSLIIRDLNNCQIEDSIQLIEPSPLISVISSANDYNGYDISCHNYSDGGVNLNITGGISPYLTSWSNGENIEDLNNLSEGLYSVSISDQNNCLDYKQIILNEPTPLNLNFDLSNYNGFNISCYGFEDGYINSVISGSVPPYSFQWNTETNTQNLDLLSSEYYNLQVTDLNNCEAFGEVTLTQPNDFFINLEFSSDTCSKGIGKGEVDITPDINPYQILWSNGETSYEINNLYSGNNSVSVTDIFGCEKSIDFLTGNLPSPTADFYIEPEKDSLFFQVNSNLNFFDQSTDSWSIIDSWNWDFGDGYRDTIINTNHSYNSIGYYNVVLRIHNIHGCMDTISKILEISDFKIHIPNVFTPQGDLINERFIANGIGINELSMIIFNRWGEVMFSTTDKNLGWDGTNQSTGKKCKQDVYIYDVNVTDVFGDLHRFTGDVTLID